MASAAPLGEVSVDVVANIDRLLRGFASGDAAAERFSRSLDSRTSRSVQNLQNGFGGLDSAAGRLGRSFDQTARSGERYAQQMMRVRTETVNAVQATDSAMSSLKRTLMNSATVITAALGLNEIRLLADGYTSYTNRLRSAGLEGERLHDTQEKLFDIAQRYGTQLTTIGSLYGRIGQAQNELGVSSGQIIEIVKGSAAAVRLFGASTEEQNGALLQLSQMLGDTNVRAQEFNSVNQGARPILIAAANGIERFHGSISKLRQAVMNQNVTSKEFVEGMLRGFPAVIEQAEKLPLTIGASFTTLNNALGRYIGQTDQSMSATQRISAGIGALANNLNVVMPILTSIILAIGVKYAAALGVATVAMIRKTSVDAAGALAMNVLANSSGRVTTTLGVTTVATSAYAGSLGTVTLEANAATAGLTRMQVVMATAGAMAKGVGSAILQAFGGWVGLAIMAVVGAVILYTRSQAAARKEVADFNDHQREASRLLQEEARQGKVAGDEIKSLGQAHSTATGYVRAFAGATGDAADALHRQAVEARNARVETLKHQAELARQDQQNAQQAQRRAETNALAAGPGVYAQLRRGNNEEYNTAGRRAQQAQQTAERLEAAAAAAGARPLESYLSPNVHSQGRDIAAELTDLQNQLVAAQKAHNEAAQRELLKQIKIRHRITELMQQGLSFEIANAQAETEGLGSANTEARFTSREQAIGVAGRELKALGLSVSENNQFGGVHANHPGMGNKAHGLFAIDVNSKAGAGETTDPVELARMDALARQYQQRGYRVLFNGKVYEAGGNGPGRAIPAGQNQHMDHAHFEAPASIVGRTMKERDAQGDAESAMARAAEEARQEQIRNLEQFQRESQGMNDKILTAKRDETVDVETIEKMERERINAERDRQKEDIENKRQRGIYTVTQAKTLGEANEQLRTLELHGIDLKEQQRKEREAATVLERTHENEVTIMNAQQDMARTDTERRAIERRILASQKEYERKVLQAIIDSPFSTALDKQLAQSDMKSLDKRYGAKEGALNRQARDALFGTAPEGSDSARDQEIKLLREQETDKLAIVQENLDNRIIKEEEAAKRRIEIETDTQAKIRDIQISADVARLEFAQQTADSLGQIAQVLFGQHSKAARAMFIVSKGFAIAEAALKLQVAIANALAIPWPANIPAIATAAALGASIITNIAAITAQFEGGGWTGGQRGRPAGTVHGEEYVIRAPYAGQNRELLDTINAGRDPTRALRNNGGAGMMAAGRMSVSIHNHAPGVEHEARMIGPHDMEIIATKVVRRDAPGVVAADMAQPNSRTSKALTRHTTNRRKRG